MSKKTELAVIDGNKSLALAEPTEMAEQDILNSDIIIPKLLLMQGLSEFVSDRAKCPITKAAIAQGDMVRSTTGEILGSPEKSVAIVPLKITNEWRLEENVGGKYEYRGVEPRTAINEAFPWEFEKDGATWKRTKVITLFALLPQDIAASRDEMKKFAETGDLPDMNRMLLPVCISFRSTSFKAGKSVATFYAQLRDLGRLNKTIRPFHYTLDLSCSAEKNDKGQFYVFSIGKTSKLSTDLVDEAARWYNILNTMKLIKVDSTGDQDAAPIPGSDQF